MENKKKSMFVWLTMAFWIRTSQIIPYNFSRLQREAKELEKLNSGIGAAIAKDLKETAKYRKWKQQNLDPRNASRTASANKEPLNKLRWVDCATSGTCKRFRFLLILTDSAVIGVVVTSLRSQGLYVTVTCDDSLYKL